MQSKIFFSSARILMLALSLVNFLEVNSSSAQENVVNQPSVPIKGHYIVVFKDTVQNPRAEVASINRDGRMRVKHVYDAALKGFAAEIPDVVLNALKNNPRIQYIEQDQTVSINNLQTQNSVPSWGLDRVDNRPLPLNGTYLYTYTGSGVVAYVIDTGIKISHPDFGSRASLGTDTIGDGQHGNDCNGHGTHVAGTVGGTAYGVAKDVSLVAVRVLSCSGSGSISGVISGVNWVVSDNASTSTSPRAGKPAVANMSLGGGASSALDSAVNTAVSKNIVFVVAAGNSNQDACRSSPARASSAITVGATTSTDSRASYSNYGSCVDLFAPGSSITSAWIGSGTHPFHTISGTSMAAPHVAGAAARLRQFYPTHTAPEIWNVMLGQVSVNLVRSAGNKSPNRLLHMLSSQ